jgi:K(+)-stimulated pyrophosphate-energized sodium pump
MENLLYLTPLFGVLGLIYMAFQSSWVTKQDTGTDRMREIAGHIAEGAMAFLKAEYRVLAIFVVVAGILLGILSTQSVNSHPLIVFAFVVGALFSACAGFIGMRIATKSNVRTTQAARTSLANALKISFTGGTVMGLGVAGLAVIGLSTLFILFFHLFMNGQMAVGGGMTKVLEVLTGFSLGAESIALFARVGGGIYTKAADVGADLVGKVEAGIPEDDPRNPATIADNVGDNVGDVAGMGADLFGSYVATVLGSMVLGNYVIQDMGGIQDVFGGIGPILLPIVIAGIGILFSIMGSWLVKVDENGDENAVQSALNRGNWASLALTAVACFFLIQWMLPATMQMNFFGQGMKDISAMRVFYAVLVGLGVGAIISMITEYYTGLGKKPVLDIVNRSATGAATNIIAGLATGMFSTAYPILLFAGAIWGAYTLAGFYGVAIAASAMMATTAMQLAIDAFGPISDNAGGIAEMSELPSEVRTRTDILDSVGNTTAAIGKGFAIASAALTALALFAAYVKFTGIDGINIFKADVLAALFIGGMIPVVFSAFAMNSVGKAAMDMVNEVRRQFREIPGIMEGTGTPEYGKCVDISTKAAIREMMTPGAITIITPILIGFIMGAEPLGGYMAGVTVSGVLWAIFQSNAGGAWDNAKKAFEKGVEIDGQIYYKKSEPHKAAVTGDTVGDPFKDTSGPSMNILIKLSSIVALIIAPYLGHHVENPATAMLNGATAVTGVALNAAGNVGNAASNAAGNVAGAAATGAYATVNDVANATGNAVNAAGNAVANLGSFFKKKLSNGVELNIPENGVENKLATFIDDANQAANKETWFNFDRLLFETGKNTLKPESQEQVKNIAEILKAYPNVNIKLGGYTDNVGKPASNLQLSAERAKNVKAELVKLGIADSRIESEGYGQEHPVADNATAEGRAQNRRIAVRVTKK